MIGAFTQQVDVAEVLYCAFMLFFVGLVLYLRREDKREGYPLEEQVPTVSHRIVGFPDMPPPKTYRLLEGGTVTLPNRHEEPALKARFRRRLPGAPLYPVGEPLLAGIGPGAYTLRHDEPFRMLDGSLQLAPLRNASDYTCVDPDMDPRGREVLGEDMRRAGVVKDLWVDKGSKILRYLEIAIDGEARHRLLPIFYASVRRKARYLRVDCIKASQFKLVPVLRDPEVITAREEDRINGFYAGGYMYSIPLREVLL